MRTIITQGIVRYFRALFLGAVILGLTLPSVFSRTYRLLTPLTIILMYLGTLDIEYNKLGSLQRYRKQTIRYMIGMMLLLPLVLFYMLNWISTDTAIGVLLLAGAPAGIAAIAFTRLMGGNTLVSLCLAVVTTVLFPLTLPLLLKYSIGTTIHVDSGAMMIDLILFCILPIAAAYCTQRYRPRLIDRLRPHIDRTSILMITLMIVGPVAVNAADFLATTIRKLLTVVAGLFVLSTVLHTAGRFCFSKTTKENQVASSLAKGFMNISITTVIAAKYFSPEVLLIVILYEFPRDLMLLPFGWFVKKYGITNKNST